MTFSIPFARNRLGWLAVGLVGLQIAFKLLVEIRLAFEAQPALGAMAVGYTLGWIVVVGLCVTGNRLGYWAGAMLGLGHFVLTAALPLTGACDHFLVAGIVMSHGLLISIACLAVLLADAQKRGRYAGLAGREALVFGLLALSTLVRTFWITFREPVGAVAAREATAGVGGLQELAGAIIIWVVGVSMVALCILIPGIVMRKRWAYAGAAVFGTVHVVLTATLVVLHVPGGVGPSIVIPASLGMLVAGAWLTANRSASRQRTVEPSRGGAGEEVVSGGVVGAGRGMP